MSSWISFPSWWKLEDVQAGLNVLITALSALVIFVFVRVSWQSGASRIVKNKAVPLPSILTVNSVGEVLDTFGVLNYKLSGNWKILAQCTVVVSFSITALVSGPITRYATRVADITTLSEVNGYLSTRYHNSNGADQVMWNLTETSLDRAGFPTDQLLDFLPDTTSHWLYRGEEWNNTWSMTCQPNERTPVDITMTNDCTDLSTKMSGLAFVIPSDPYSDYSYYSYGDYYINQTMYRDVIMFFYNANYSNYDNDTDIYLTVSMSLAALYMHYAPKNETADSTSSAACQFGSGPVETSSFTRIDCDIEYNLTNSSDAFHSGFPDTGDVDAIPSAFVDYYFPRFKQESIGNNPISVINPKELRRFYQVYIVTKDVQDRMPVKRNLSVEISVVQISAVFLAIYSVMAFLVILGGIKYAFFLLRYRSVLGFLPQGKFDWVSQAITATARNQAPRSDQSDWVVTSAPHSDISQTSPEKRRQMLFQTAWYGPGQPQEPQQVFYPNKMVLANPTSSANPVSVTNTNPRGLCDPWD